MSAHDDMLDNVAAYALGTLDAVEARAVVLHLDTCAECREEYDALRPVVTAVATAEAMRGPAPSPFLKARIMREVRASTVAPVRRIAWVPAAVAAAALALAFGLGTIVMQQQRTIADLSSAHRYTFAQGDVLVAGSRLYVVVHGLPAPPPGKVYQMWTLAKGAKAVAPSVTFTPDTSGSALVAVPVDASTTAAAAISVEPAGGSQQPTSKPIAVIKLGA